MLAFMASVGASDGGVRLNLNSFQSVSSTVLVPDFSILLCIGGGICAV